MDESVTSSTRRGRAWRRRLSKLSRRANRLVGPALTQLRGFGVLEHVGRVSGTVYRTPLRLLGDPTSGMVHIALTYGPTTDWYRNLLATDGRFRSDGQTYRVSNPQIVRRDEVHVGPFTRRAMMIAGIDSLVRLDIESVDSAEGRRPEGR